MSFYVINDVEYGDVEGAIYLMDEYGEIVMWDIQEWIDEPDLMGTIVDMIEFGYSQGGRALRDRLDKCKYCEQYAHSHDLCSGHFKQSVHIAHYNRRIK